MLDVHAPHENIHGVRDFLLHLLTITVGLLIALSLEAAVEAVHHRHQRKEAEALIRQELGENRQSLHDSSAALKAEIDGMRDVLKTLDAISNGQSGKLKEGELHFSEGPMQDSAWRTASTTGALVYMDYGQVQKFSNAYKEQDQLQKMEELTVNDYLQLEPVLQGGGGFVDEKRATEALPYARSAMGHLSGMYFIGVGTLGAYDDALK
jgi:cell division protein FtsB